METATNLKNITTALVELSGGLISLNPEPADDGRGYICFDSGAVECETGEFLYGFIRLIKPKNVLTTGIFTGVSDMYIAQALKDNGYGNIDALEFEISHLERANKLWQKIGVDSYITSQLISSLEFKPQKTYDFMFLDTEPIIRYKELVRFYPNLMPGGFVFLHDLPRGFCKDNITPDHPEFQDWPWGPIPKQIIDWVNDDELRPWHFPNPREMCGFYRTRSDDFKWR